VERKWETVCGTRAHARVAGTGPPIVLVHGLGVSSLYFVPLARRLSSTHMVLAPDLPGYGRSGTPTEPLDIARLAQAVRQWLDLTGIDRAPIVANSLGCQIAAELALSDPERVDRLVLIGPTMDPAAPTLRHQCRRLAADALREPFALNLVETRDYLRMGPRRILATARHALADPLREKLPRVSQPALVVRGERDRIVSQEWAEEVARLLPAGRLAVVADAPHAAHWAAADQVVRLIEEFQ
jgi:2-hydroxy-6-oxonona-2,4-dienedioate hydrolase